MTSRAPVSRRRTLSLLLGGSVLPLVGSAGAEASWLSDAFEALKSANSGPASQGQSRDASPILRVVDPADGVREMLKVATTRALERVGRQNGFLFDRAIHINLPKTLHDVQGTMERFGMSGQLDELELRLNRAGEKAAPLGKAIFFEAIATVSVPDALEIIQGPDDSATRYFKKRMKAPLTDAFRPVVVSELEDAGAMQTFDGLVERYAGIPFLPDISTRARSDLIDHGLKYSLKGIFHYMAKEEAAIRRDPARRTTDVLMSLFGIG